MWKRAPDVHEHFPWALGNKMTPEWLAFGHSASFVADLSKEIYAAMLFYKLATRGMILSTLLYTPIHFQYVAVTLLY